MKLFCDNFVTFESVGWTERDSDMDSEEKQSETDENISKCFFFNANIAQEHAKSQPLLLLFFVKF